MTRKTSQIPKLTSALLPAAIVAILVSCSERDVTGGKAFSVTNALPPHDYRDLILCNNQSKGLTEKLPAEVELWGKFEVDTWLSPYWAYVQYDIRPQGCGDPYFGQIQMSLNNETPQAPELEPGYKSKGAAIVLQNVKVVRQGDPGAYWYKLVAELPPPPSPSSYTTVPYRGINLAGGEFGPPPVVPIPSAADYYVELGMNTMRIPVKWEYLQPALDQSIDWNGDYGQSMDTLIRTLTSWGLTVVIDVHNYMRYNDKIIGSGESGAPTTGQYAQLWAAIATHYAVDPQVIFDLMNEPHDMDTQLVLTNYNAAIAAIRQAESSAAVPPHLILIEGNQWSGLHSWAVPLPGGSNAEVFVPANVKDPGNYYAINVHQYLDSNFSGQSGNCIASDGMLDKIHWTSFVDWMNKYKVKVMLTEFGSGGEEPCGKDIEILLQNIQDHAEVEGNGGFIGWTAWVGGSFGSDYVLCLNPGGPANPLLSQEEGYARFLTQPARQ